MNIESHNKKTKYKVEITAGLVFASFVLWACISQLHSPLTCKQAGEAWQKNHHGTPNSQQVERSISNRDTIHVCL